MKHGKEKHAKPRKIKVFRILILAICCFTMIYSGIKIIKWYKENKQNKAIMNDILNNVEIKQNKTKVDFNKLKEQNKDTVAWLKVEGTDINYPVVKGTNNDYYLYHSFDNEYNSAGWIFADYKNKFDGTDKHIVIFGHNRKDGSMFGTLKNVLKEDWCLNQSNRIISLITEEGTKKYEVFSVYKIANEDYYIQTNFRNNEEFSEFVKTIKTRSIYDFKQGITQEDEVLTLSTCGQTSKDRVVLHAKKID